MEIKRALIIDDDALYRQALRIVLEEANLEVDEAEDGQTGLEMAQKTNYSIIFCDMRMPGIKGDSVISALKAEESTSSTPVVLMTGNLPAARDDAGVIADYYLAKPFTLEELFESLRCGASYSSTTKTPCM